MNRRIEYLPLSEITPFDRNPKGHADSELRASIERFGFTNGLLLCERRQELAEGHGRLGVLLSMEAEQQEPPEGIQITEGGNWLAPVQRGWASSDDEEFEAYVVAANQLTILGGWDRDIVSYLEDLDDLTGTGFDEAEIEALRALNDDAPEPPERFYNQSINVPQYEPVGPIPELSELIDRRRSDHLKAEIAESQIPEDIRQFLMAAADRHTVFNYRKAAEYYPYATPEVKQLMEASALVIIDPEDAIKLGFAKLESTLEELRIEDEEE